MTAAEISITLQAGINPPALRFMLQQYNERCQSEVAALLSKHATMAARGVTQSRSKHGEECMAASACVKANIAALRVLLRLEPAPDGVVSAKLIEQPDPDTSLSLYDDLEQVLLHVARDWDDDIRTLVAERARVVQVLTRLVPPAVDDDTPRRRVLVAGSGLGRMSFQLCQHGYDVDAVDASLAMTLAAATMSDRAAMRSDLYAVRCHPWLLRSANLRDTATRFRSVVAPVSRQPPAWTPTAPPTPQSQPQPKSQPSLPSPSLLQAPAMTAAQLAADFNLDAGCGVSNVGNAHGTAAPELRFMHGRFPGPTEIYEAQTHDCVVSHFFIDAVMEDLTVVIDAVARALKVGGIWLCIGPLKWQQAPGRLVSSFYSWEEVLLLVEASGFQLLGGECRGELNSFEPCDYLPRSGGEMQREIYEAGCFVARRET